MCLLVVAWQTVDGWPLVVGANRDEWLDRPATPMTVLQASGPRILGGRDERAGGTWLAVNEHGVVCGLTNRPLPDGPDPTKSSRGRLPLLAAQYASAVEGAAALAAAIRTNAYNAAWLLVGDRRSLFSVAVEPDRATEPEELLPGVHVLENAPLGDESLKVDHVHEALEEAEREGVAIWDALPHLLRLHSDSIPPGHVPHFPDGRERMAATLAPCVHAEGYGTRSSTLIRVDDDGSRPIELLVAGGPPCTTPYTDVTGCWSPEDGG
jgi:uncharacterized protein with NRDE domain